MYLSDRLVRSGLCRFRTTLFQIAPEELFGAMHGIACGGDIGFVPLPACAGIIEVVLGAIISDQVNGATGGLDATALFLSTHLA
jgi:hypothetical protein